MLRLEQSSLDQNVYNVKNFPMTNANGDRPI